MKICVDCRELARVPKTGTARFLENFLEHLEPAARRDIRLVTDRPFASDSRAQGFEVARLGRSPAPWFDQVMIPRFLRRQRCEVFFSPYFKLPFFTRVARVITIHDLHFLRPMLRRGLERCKPYGAYLDQAVRCAGRIVTVSEFSKQEIVRILAVAPGKISVVHNAVGRAFGVPEQAGRSEFLRRSRIGQEYILFVGTFKAHKNAIGLLEAYALLAKDMRARYRLVLVAAQDENFKSFPGLIRRRGLGDSVVCIDYVSDADLALLYGHASLFVFPSYYEGFGLPALEAMACGAPVVSSQATSLPEVLGQAALYVDPGSRQDIADKIARVLSDEDLRRSLIEKGTAQAQKYRPEVFSRSLFDAITGSLER